jgi:hypothetical protein
MERSLLEILRNTIYRNGFRSSDISQNTIWAFNQQGLVCLTCKEDPESDEDSEGVNFEVEEPETGEYNREELDSISRAKFNEPKQKANTAAGLN